MANLFLLPKEETVGKKKKKREKKNVPKKSGKLMCVKKYTQFFLLLLHTHQYHIHRKQPKNMALIYKAIASLSLNNL